MQRAVLVMAWAWLASCGALARAESDLGLQVAEGFEVSLYADDDLAHDIFSMTIDGLGRVVVSGPGYVRILLDTDGDGRAESFKQLADGPATGAQGLYFHGRDLLCTGDAGLIRYRDRDGDDRADGPPDLFLKMKAGGEHDSHAIRQGPDGWWYVLSGNMAGIDHNYVTRPSSPVRRPEHGTLMRLSPDLGAGEVVAHGFRNSYDFDFDALGDIAVFDSDGEREISLPWYQPTRVFEVVAGGHAGWFSHNWKRSSDFFDMPPVIAEFGRGSPTGVVCYRHTQFPPPYRGAFFVLDWTYGRVFAIPLNRAGSADTGRPIQFLTSVGEHGFAPTDAEVGPDGSLFVAVGGRGTRGSVYRVRATGRSADLPASSPLDACLTAPQPLSSWSRRDWEPVAESLGRIPFEAACRDERRPPAARLRAIEIMTEKFGGVDEPTAAVLARSPRNEIRARTAWALGRTRSDSPMLTRLIDDADPFVQRQALEACLAAEPSANDARAKMVAQALSSTDRFVRMAAARVAERMSQAAFMETSAAAMKSGWQAAVPVAVAFQARQRGYQPYTVEIARRILLADHPLALKREAARLMEIGLGDVAPPEGRVPGVFEGYASREELRAHSAELEPAVAAVAASFPSGDAQLDFELGRVMAMLEPNDADLLERVVSQITADSDPVRDLHWLTVAARLPAPRPEAVREALAAGLVRLEGKFKERSLAIDSSWDDRVLEMYLALVDRDRELAVALLAQPDFGRPGHVALIRALPPERFPEAVTAFMRQINRDPDYAWNGEVIFLLNHARDPQIRELVRSKGDDLALRNAVLMALAEEPLEQDRERFIAGIDNAPLDVLAECVKSLLLLDAAPSPGEQVTLVRALRRLGDRGQERQIRDQIVEVLQRDNRTWNGYRLGQDGVNQQPAIDAWTASTKASYPEEYARQVGESAAELAQLQELLQAVDWTGGDASRGQKLFESRACVQCHGSRRALGPDLHGVAQRFSREDLFTAILLPNRDVSPRYQTTAVLTREGQLYTGLIVYESVDGLVLRNSTNQTFRIETRNIESRRTRNESLMPAGLLKDLRASDLADLYAFLRSMTPTAVAAEADPHE